MQTDYQPFVDRMIHRYEGGYGWNQKDPGGPTNFGITCYDLAEHRGKRMTSMAAWAPLVHDMTLAEAEDIYREKYATAIHFDDLPAGIDDVMMDYAVNSGYARAIRVARALCKLSAGDTWDAILLDAIKNYPVDKFINDICDERLRYMHAIRNGTAWEEFGKGWGARVADLRQYALDVAHKQVPKPAPDLSKVSTPKADHTPVNNDKANAGKVGITVVLASIAHMLGAHTGVVIAVAGVAFAGFIGYEIWKTHRAVAANQVVHV